MGNKQDMTVLKESFRFCRDAKFCVSTGGQADRWFRAWRLQGIHSPEGLYFHNRTRVETRCIASLRKTPSSPKFNPLHVIN
jgi:hypothetical protein